MSGGAIDPSSTTPRLRMAMVGVGWWGTELAVAGQAEGAEIAACFSPTRLHRESFAARFGCRAFDSLEAFSDREYDLVCIATPNGSSVDVALQVADCARALWLEKPGATSSDHLGSILGPRLSARVFVGYDKKFHPACIELRRLMTKGIGEIRAIECEFRLGRYVAGKTGWRDETRHCPLGPFTQLGVHHVDTVSWLLGAPLCARDFSFKHRHGDVPGIVELYGDCEGIPTRILSDYTSSESRYGLRIEADRVYELRGNGLLIDGVPAIVGHDGLSSMRNALHQALRAIAADRDVPGLELGRAFDVLEVHDSGVESWRRQCR